MFLALKNKISNLAIVQLPKVSGITVNTVHSNKFSIEKIPNSLKEKEKKIGKLSDINKAS